EVGVSVDGAREDPSVGAVDDAACLERFDVLQDGEDLAVLDSDRTSSHAAPREDDVRVLQDEVDSHHSIKLAVADHRMQWCAMSCQVCDCAERGTKPSTARSFHTSWRMIAPFTTTNRSRYLTPSKRRPAANSPSSVPSETTTSRPSSSTKASKRSMRLCMRA